MFSSFLQIIGTVDLPTHLEGGYGNVDDSAGGRGLIGLISNIIKLIITVGGLWAFVNLVMAGFYYVMYGDKPDELVKVHQKIYQSGIGLVVMVSSFVITGIISFLLYGEAGAILNLTIYGPTN